MCAQMSIDQSFIKFMHTQGTGKEASGDKDH